MELVYLWVEDYKNIKNQGFNFSPRFDCSYNEDTKELTINENKDYVHIFSENINVTAIVGENGSGKSSLINHFITKQKGFFVINENNNLKIYYTKISVQSGYEKTKLTNNFYLNTLFYSMDNTSHIKTNRNITHIEHEYINELIVRNFEIIQETEFNLFNFKPYYISFSLIDYWIPEEYDDYEKDIKKFNLY